MILIADSGSTKCQWIIFNTNGENLFELETIGFNPYFVDDRFILSQLNDSELNQYKNRIDSLYFYGAGCGMQQQRLILADAFKQFFINSSINIYHDLEAACFAMYRGNPNITCILGTGSNSCYFDGSNIIENAPSLGFLLGDEASGNYFGKKILNLYFNNKLPQDLHMLFEKDFNPDLALLKEKIYNNPRSNMYLASYFPFLFENKSHPVIKKIILDGLEHFFDLHVSCFKKHEVKEINFIGSVSFFLRDEISDISHNHNLLIGDIIKNPIKKLIEYHINNNIL